MKNKNKKNIFVFKNKDPEWDEKQQTFTLNFRGRVTKTSIKNFQICLQEKGHSEGEQDNIFIQFGKIDQNLFNLDVMHPFSIYQAFGTAICSLDKKLALG